MQIHDLTSSQEEIVNCSVQVAPKQGRRPEGSGSTVPCSNLDTCIKMFEKRSFLCLNVLTRDNTKGTSHLTTKQATGFKLSVKE